ncbi:MAG TPA: CHAT domain-containing protein [Terracidiphilus sp.]|nr:CHAT domain-containing protein [Terracidiphilus sp.]
MFPPPSGAKLAPTQRETFKLILSALAEMKFDRLAIHAKQRELVAWMTSINSTDEDQRRMGEELEDWVRWYRLPGYYLAFLFQEAMRDLRSFRFPIACLLFADAQDHFAEDLSLHSRENAYSNWHAQMKSLYTTSDNDQAPDSVGAFLRYRLRITYGYYYRLYSSTPYSAINPLSEHLYFEKPWHELKLAFPEIGLTLNAESPALFEQVVDRCAGPEDVYCRVVALRHLGLWHAGKGNYQAAQAAYQTAMSDAKEVKLDAEIAHLHRLLGMALREDGKLDDAELEFRKAFTQDSHPKFSYWQAIDLCEIGDVRMRRLPPVLEVGKNPPEMAGIEKSYALGRQAFESHIGGTVLPIARAIKQQMMRSYADNSIQIAAQTGPEETLGVIEVFGPRYATDVVAESRVAAETDAPEYARFRQARAIVHRDLATVSTSANLDTAFEQYLASIVEQRPERQFYLHTRNRLSPQISRAQLSSAVVEQTRSLRIADTVFLLFYVGRVQTYALLIDAASGQIVMSSFVSLSADEWKECHDAYGAEVTKARGSSRPALFMRPAIDSLIDFYQRTFGRLFDMFAPALVGKHLKIFPRFRMNDVPLHALRVGGKRLIEVCDVSYASSLSLFLQIHGSDAAVSTGGLAILRDAARTPAYAGTIKAIAAQRNNIPVSIPNPPWQNFQTALAETPPTDIFFACHGRFDQDDPRKSRLEVTQDEPVDFTELLSDLDLRNCQSVFMGACESGLGRTLVSAEYAGLPTAFFAAGVRCVIGTLWEVNQLAAAIVVAKHYSLLHSGIHRVCACLNEAARQTMAMSRDEVIAWVRELIPERATAWEREICKLEDPPFNHPYYWAGFFVSGDV